jgi:organic hydroperoxide reductase OsmC/OhrA
MPLKISARVNNGPGRHEVTPTTTADEKKLTVPLKNSGPGSSINDGEFLMPAVATCYCNDFYRESARLGISIESVEVEARAEFAGIELASRKIRYSARVVLSAPLEPIAMLLRKTDAVAEVHNTLQTGIYVSFSFEGTHASSFVAGGPPCIG